MAEQPMASPQQQLLPLKAEAQRPRSSGWGTCAELLLVSAVKKHGASNWKLIALELKARAILLNLSPSCFSEEACRFRYNVLKGKFASSSDSGVSVGDDVDFDGGVLLEELRKLRMSHLKEELQRYDSSIGQLQSRIRKMKEERAQLKNHANNKQGGESNSADLYPKALKSSEFKTPLARKIDELSEKAAGNNGKSHVQPPFGTASRRRSSSSMSQVRHFPGIQVQPASTSKTVFKDLTGDLQLAGECWSAKSPSAMRNGQQSLVSEEEPFKVENASRSEGEFLAPSSRSPDQGRKNRDKKSLPPANPRQPQLSRTASWKGEKGRESARSRASGSDKPEQADVAERPSGLCLNVNVPPSPRISEPSASQLSTSNQLSDGKEIQRILDPKTPLEDKLRCDLCKPSGGSGEADDVLRQDTDGEAKENRAIKVEMGARKESLKPAAISYGRSISKNRLKCRDDGRALAFEARLTQQQQQRISIGEGGGVQDDEGKAASTARVSSDQRVEKGMAIGSDLFRGESIDIGSSKGGSESVLTSDHQEAEDKVVELKGPSDVRKLSCSIKNVEFKDGGELNKVWSLNKVLGGRKVNDDRRPPTNNIILGSRESSEEEKPTNTSKNVGAREGGDEKKSSSVNKITGSNEVISDKKAVSVGKVMECRDILDGKKTMSINKLVNRDKRHEKKLGSSSKVLESREKLGNNNSKLMESTELSEGKKPTSSKTAEPKDVSDAMKAPNSNSTVDVGSSDPLDSVADRNPLSGNVQLLDIPTPSASGDIPPKIVSSSGRPDVILTRRRSESPQAFEEIVSLKGSPHLFYRCSDEPGVATHTDSCQKLKRLGSGKAVKVIERERKRRSVSKPSSDVTGKRRPLKRHLKQEVKTVDLDTDSVKERKVDPKLQRSRSITNDVPDPLCRKESGNAQEESRDCLESGERQQGVVNYDTSQIENNDAGSSMDTVDDMSPSSRKNRREAKVPGKFLHLLECLRVICSHKSASLFKQRQEYQEKRHYNSIVRRHVDLDMVRSRLEGGGYTGSVEFFRDLHLLFTNALVYNSKDSQEYAGAKALRSCAQVEIEKILKTEGLLKLHGPATRKREMRKSEEVHRDRLCTGSGVEVRKKRAGKRPSEGGVDVDVAHQSAGPVDDCPTGGRSSNVDEEGREVDGNSDAFKKSTPNRNVREESQRREAPKTELNSGGNRRSLPVKGKKTKTHSAAQPSKSCEAEETKPTVAGMFDIVSTENISIKVPPSLKDVMCVDPDSKATWHKPTGPQQRPPQSMKHGSASRPGQSISRGPRYSKRAGDSSGSNPKKRSRK